MAADVKDQHAERESATSALRGAADFFAPEHRDLSAQRYSD
jgi:hypothetical protein